MSPDLIPVEAAGGIVFRYRDGIKEVLLIHRNGHWDIPKGKRENNESIPMCAVREVAEEVGSSLPSIVKDLGTTFHTYERKGKDFGKTTWWYSMIFTKNEELIPQEEEGIEKVEWVELSKAKEMVGYDNLKEIIERYSRA